MNDTIAKFGYPRTLIAEYDHWVVLLREKQLTAGCLILACTGAAEALPDIGGAAFEVLAKVTRDIEHNLKCWIRFERINYLMLMMVDPHVHFHVIPRYRGKRELAGQVLADTGWPKPPDLGAAVQLVEADAERVVRFMRESWVRLA
ncbi:MAG: HIT family protein [Deltaproteobacteria bacterium]|nr:HIT family protein [Deltaproteobacteria bacterium]